MRELTEALKKTVLTSTSFNIGIVAYRSDFRSFFRRYLTEKKGIKVLQRRKM